MNKRLLPVAAILIAFIVFGVIGLREPADMASTAELLAPLQAEYDYSMSNMVLDRFTPNGELNYRITADTVTHYPAGDLSVLDNPAMTWIEPGRSPWLVTARSGVLSPDASTAEDRLVLQDSVVAQGTSTAGKALTITTESLTVEPATKELNTAVAVALDSGTLHLTSVGMRANLTADRIDLFEEVRGHYE